MHHIKTYGAILQTVLRGEIIRSKVTRNRNSIKEPTFQSILGS